MSVTEENSPNELVFETTDLAVGDGPVPDPDALFQTLSTPIRRQTLFYLLHEPKTTIDELADVIAGWRSTNGGAVGPAERDQIGIELRHVHLPLLASAALIEYDSTAGTVALDDVPPPVRDLVRYAHSYEQAVETTQ